MGNNIEDILIGNNYRENKKKGGGAGLFLIIILLLLLLGAGGAYWYFSNYKSLNSKQLFFTHFSNSNIKNITQDNIYVDLFEKMMNTNFEANSTINCTTNVKKDDDSDIDISRFTFNMKNQNNVNDSKTYSELGIIYSGNEELKIKLLTNEKCIAIASDEIVNRYVGVHYNYLKTLFGIDINQNTINHLKLAKKNNLTNGDKDKLVADTVEKISEMVPDENFTIQENISLSQDDGEAIPVTGYTLTLSQEQLRDVLVQVLRNIKNDENLLKKLVFTDSELLDNKSKDITVNPINAVVDNQVDPNLRIPISQDGTQQEEELPEEQEREQSTIEANPEDVVEERPASFPAGSTEVYIEEPPANNPIEQPQEEPEENINEPEVVDGQLESNVEAVSGEVNEFNQEQEVEGEYFENEFEENWEENSDEFMENEYNEEDYRNENDEYYEPNQITLNQEVGNQELQLQNSINTFDKFDAVGIESSYEYIELIELLCGLKTNKTVDELKDLIGDCIENINHLSGNGLTITVYASSEKTEKISVTLPNENTIDIEILKKSDLNNKLKVTYLYNGNNNLLNINSKDIEYSAESAYVKENDDQTNGLVFEINKSTSATSTSLNITVSFIENQKINKKINIKSDFKGTITSNSMVNDSIITISTNENETKWISETDINFSKKEEIEDLTDVNCLFLENLDQEEYVNTIQAIKDKIKLVWEEKKEHFDFIDTNQGAKAKIQVASSLITKEQAKQALQDKITSIINEAQENEEEITIQNLENLQIDGYEVSTVINEDTAAIVVDIYTFVVNSEFNIISE